MLDFDSMDMGTPTQTPQQPQSQFVTADDSRALQYPGQQPMTPDLTGEISPMMQPVNLQREQQPPQKFRIRRRKTNPQAADLAQFRVPSSRDIPVPTIELSYMKEQLVDTQPLENFDDTLLSPALTRTPQPEDFDSSLLSPTVVRQRFVTPPPRTPVGQIRAEFDGSNDNINEWIHTPRRGPAFASSIERPSSSLSILSDSSVSSVSSSDTYGDSCTSPDSDTTDPFIFPEVNTTVKPRQGLASPIRVHSSKPRKRVKTTHHVKWTQEMDDHLWKTFLAYQTDPEVTPFKALPGVPPPLGVCHRVARQAKRTWKASRNNLQPISEASHGTDRVGTSIDAVMRESSAPPSISTSLEDRLPEFMFAQSDPIFRCHSSNSNEVNRKRPGRWPRSEASTRRRLRELCKSKPNIPAHYQRLMQSRSPSPFTSSSSTAGQRSPRVCSSPKAKGPKRQKASLFSTSDLQLSLKAHTMSSMQPGNPLHQLSSGQSQGQDQGQDQGQGPVSRQQPATWPPSSSRGVHQKSRSLHGTYGPQSRQAPQPLASPFQQPSEDRFIGRNQATVRSRGQAPPSSYQPANEEPWQIHAPRPMSGSMKRRAEYQLGEETVSQDLEARRDFLQSLFRDNIRDGHRRVRSRGFSLGAVRQRQQQQQQQQGNNSLSDLFAPPVEEQVQQSIGASMMQAPNLASPPITATAISMTLSPPLTSTSTSSSSSTQIPRLGSPFIPQPPTYYSNTFPRSLFPHGLDTIMSRETQRQDHGQGLGEGEGEGEGEATVDQADAREGQE